MLKTFTATVDKKSGANSVRVIIEISAIHPLYKKRYMKTRRLLVHTDADVDVGDLVVITPCRPVSKSKSWKVVQVKTKGGKALLQIEDSIDFPPRSDSGERSEPLHKRSDSNKGSKTNVAAS